MALTDKLTAIAEAIRGKTGGTGELTLDQMVTEIAGIESGGGLVVGNFTPTANTLTLDLDVGSDFTNILIFTYDEFLTGIKSFKGGHFGFSTDGVTDHHYWVGTNNAGMYASGYVGFASASNAPTKNGNMITFKNGASGNEIGYFLGGNTYNWLAW